MALQLFNNTLLNTTILNNYTNPLENLNNKSIYKVDCYLGENGVKSFNWNNNCCNLKDDIRTSLNGTRKKNFYLRPFKIPVFTVKNVLLLMLASIISLTTILGNMLVMISLIIDRQLRTISNYYLLSLSIADFMIGLISMPLYSIYIFLDYWPLNKYICDAWLSLDYLMSNASVLNLLVISFDRYFSVTRPLTYRLKRTTKRAFYIILSTYLISSILWPPWIIYYPIYEGRTVPDDECYIQFLKTSPGITSFTAIAAFYIPVVLMIYLNWKIWRETQQRYKDITTLFHVSTGISIKMIESQNNSTNKNNQDESEPLTISNDHLPINNSKRLETNSASHLNQHSTSNNMQSNDNNSTTSIKQHHSTTQQTDQEDTNNAGVNTSSKISGSNIGGNSTAGHYIPQQPKSERKAAKILSAILLVFIITWAPYNILALLRPILNGPGQKTEVIPKGLWLFCYFLRYINSTLNPVCYALCNAAFRRTFIRILKCKWTKSKRTVASQRYQQDKNRRLHDFKNNKY